ncbi:23S rRNA (adenine(2503)-C(2))-methyltransferase RlmN [Peptoniphilus sp. KCTC 25270]|uniref:23S rRNA (adenine(2503)-C(2))-methyltransferase RlmN n=1 Tax=Peptoniphilus sp. KCTC 25270 TaxID=2897414 RepID=UPI001E3A0A1E|nr:23S rRNA (adenine(2503)-C(2))-methyltransferase RlmN [Peptoniphilus sp. KCTC 25270]MCD1147112.1 23S rRNA (adenine(2503)-C(2))-methyltransferase RlmN [Peptoniphilus sp. KCTC 25270]
MHWLEMTEKELCEYFKAQNLPSFRGTQVFEGIHGQRKTLEEIQNVPKKIKEILPGALSSVQIEKVFPSKKDDTKKMLYRLEDGELIEGVLMKYKHGHSLCVSTQVGCKMGCRFCASTQNGKIRDLRPFEMLEQIYVVERELGVNISNIILMGSGEPLDNYENVIQFLRVLHDPKGKNLSYRSMTISTCGLVPEILRLAEEQMPVQLAISLHETDQKRREKLMPVAHKHSLSQLFKALREYQEKTKQRVTLEYTMIEGENDQEENLKELIRWTENLNVLINLIPLNPNEHYNGKRPDRNRIYQFQHRLEKNHRNATVRRELGSDINASCGQLKAGYENGIKGVRE